VTVNRTIITPFLLRAREPKHTFACRGEKLRLGKNITRQPSIFSRPGDRPGARDLSNPGLLDKKQQSTDMRRLTTGIRSE
jgi:hypothetical protein